MATDVGLFPKRTVLDFFKPQAVKGPILDKMTTEKTSLKFESDKTEIIDDAEEMSHKVGKGCVHGKAVNNSNTKTRRKINASDSGPLTSCSTEALEAGSKLNKSPQLDLSTSVFKKSHLMTKKKGKRTNKQAEADLKEKSEKDAGEYQRNSTVESVHMQEEIEYADFVKSLSLAQNGNSTNCDGSETVSDDTSTDHHEEKKSSSGNANLTEQTEQCLEVHSISCDKKKDADVDLRYRNQNKPKTLKTRVPNAFSFLMQVRSSGKGPNRSSEDDSLLEKENVTNSKDEMVELRSGCSKDEDASLASDTLLERTPSSSTPSVLNFFTKCVKPAKRDDGGGLVLVTVDVHHDPSEQSLSTDKTMLSKVHDMNASKLAPIEDGNEIVFLGTETVDEGCFKENQSKSKGKQTSSLCKEPSSKTLNGYVTCDKLENSTFNTQKKEFLKDSTPLPDKSFKKAQATLDFSKGYRLSMNSLVKPKPAKKLAKSNGDQEEADFTGVKDLNKVRTMRRGRRKGQITCDTKYEESNDQSVESPARIVNNKNKTTQRKMLTRQRKSLESGSGREANDFTSKSKQVLIGSASKYRAQELLQRAKQQKDKKNVKMKKAKCLRKTGKKSSTVNESRKTVEQKTEGSSLGEQGSRQQGSRRQSRRLAEQQKMRRDTEQVSCLIIDSDDDSSSDDTKTFQKNCKKGESHSSPRKMLRQSKKRTGKLAPIFAKKKVEEKAPELSEDPEIVRRRKEFLMSGVPSEMKKLALSSIPGVITSDFAPFPETSHVQQRTSSSMWSLVAPGKMKMMCTEYTDEIWEIKASELKWQSLHWQPTVKEPFVLSPLLQSSHHVTPEMQEVQLKNLVQTNFNFSFAALHDKFKAQWSGKSSKTGASRDRHVTSNMSSDSDVIIIEQQESSSSMPNDKGIIIEQQESSSSTPNDKDTCTDGTWPEVLQPKSISEMIGNDSCIRRLKYWLEEWKVFIEREARMSAKVVGGHYDSDFDLSEDDSDEDSQLCNTMLLVGPHGVGKTAAAYALAHQLCYKVFEVNASSSRQGRQILAQLQEATQSHQVAQKKDGIVFNTQPVTPLHQSQLPEQLEMIGASKKSDKTVPKAFANFFKKTSNVAEGEKPSTNVPLKESKKSWVAPEKNKQKETNLDKDVSRKRKADDSEEESKQKKLRTCKLRKEEKTAESPVKESEDTSIAGKLNLSSTSLILFDEVDLVFEEDSGFLQTVQHFINTTKIPIIMTTSDPGFQRQISAKFETLIFKPPALEMVASYLQTVCLAAGLRTSPSDVTAVATLSKGDLRHALLSLQFLALSKEGVSKELNSLSLRTAHNTTTMTSSASQKVSSVKSELLIAEDANDSDEDFSGFQPIHKKACRRVDDDDDREAVSTAEGAKAVGRNKGAGVNITTGDMPVPSVHLSQYRSILGLSCDLDDLFSKCMKDKYNGYLIQLMTSECLKLHQYNLDILQSNLMQLLPLPKESMLYKRHHSGKPFSATLKRRIQSDVFDSEASDEEDTKSSETEIHPADACDARKGLEIWPQQKQYVSGIHHQEGLRKQELTVNMMTDTEEEVNDLREVGKKEEYVAIFENCSSGKYSDKVHDASLISEKNASIENSTKQDLVNLMKEDKTTGQGMKNSLRVSKACTDGGLGSRLLSSFARYYESQSCAYSHLCDKYTLPTTTLTDKWTLLPGTDDMESVEDAWCGKDSLRKEISMELGVRCSRCLWQDVDKSVTTWKQHSSPSHPLPDGCSVSVPQAEVPFTMLTISSNTEAISIPGKYKRALNNVINSLPLTSYSNLNPVVMDYLPTLRVITQAERYRQIAKAKRRFHHHFDNIGLYLNESTLSSLCEEFPPPLPSELKSDSSLSM